MGLGITIDVPDLAAGLAFYLDVFGWEEVARPLPVYAIVQAEGLRIGLMEKAAGTVPAPGASPRDYARHWTPVHLDLHVADYAGTLARLRAGGGTVEAEHAVTGRPPVAFCADPFGHGLCILGVRS
jgi:predicted enzyme related to lactoylglutathione lyase